MKPSEGTKERYSDWNPTTVTVKRPVAPIWIKNPPKGNTATGVYVKRGVKLDD